jgi:3-hydroxyisobutyrate dehydrogenase-like beta-hydroxyacid dehydrogenase
VAKFFEPVNQVNFTQKLLTKMKTGFAGLGNLGLPIVENLLATGTIYIYNRTKEKAETLIGKGAIVCNSIKELASQCDIVFSIVSDDAAVRSITEGPDGIAANLKTGGIHISLSTILPETSRALASLHRQHNNFYIASPVMGRPEVAKAKKINFLVSGDTASIQAIKPLLQHAGGAGVWEFGEEVGAANIAKLCSNYVVLTAMEALSESINLANKSKIDTRQWLNMLTQTLFNSPAYLLYSKLIFEETFSPTSFSAKLGLKDMNLILQQASSAKVKMPVGQEVQSLLKQMIDAGKGEEDVTALAKMIKEL